MNRGKAWPVALTIAGSDCSAGAGLQADLKTFAAHQIYGASVVTAVTAQNTRGLGDCLVLPRGLITAQLAAVLDDLPVAAAKTGMLGSEEVVEAVTEILGQRNVGPLVIDPVLRSSSGTPLLDERGVTALRRTLLPLATLVTPNREEAAILAGGPGAGPRDRARQIAALGVGAVLITGGDTDEDPVLDLLYDGHGFQEITRPRVRTTSTHGTGCTLSAAITARLARGDVLAEAVAGACDFVRKSLESARAIGEGSGPLHHFHALWREP